MTLESFLSRLIPALERAEVPYMLTGSVASSAHGSPRSTRDVDIVIAPSREQLISFLKTFETERYYADEQQALQALVHRSQFNVIDFATGWKADFIFAEENLYARTAFARRIQMNLIGSAGVFVASPEDVLLAKLQWAKKGESERQLLDAAGIFRAQGDKLDLSYVQYWVRELQLTDLWDRVRETSGSSQSAD